MPPTSSYTNYSQFRLTDRALKPTVKTLLPNYLLSLATKPLRMKHEIKYTPDYIFETSWEVCNKVGGIYTVLSTRANSMQQLHKDKTLFIGPDVLRDSHNPWFLEDNKVFGDWIQYALTKENLDIRVGRWDVPGNPIAILINYKRFFKQKNEIYGQMWADFGVDSMQANGDYDDSCLFSYAAGVVIESFYRFHNLEDKNIIAHFNEWQTGMGALYIKKNVPKIATAFTTHATGIGRSIAGNGFPLYNHLSSYNGDQMARQLGMVAKHSVEKQAALNVDCFTTVSDITARECAQFLQRQPDVITTNGFEKGFIPKGTAHKAAIKNARKILLAVAEKTLGHSIHKDALFVATSGRYEYKNKGIDVFIDAMNQLRQMKHLSKDVIAFIMVPGWIKGPRQDLMNELNGNGDCNSEGRCPFVTHELHDPNNDPVMNQIRHLGFCNAPDDRVKIIFVPSYLHGSDGIFNADYYDLLVGMDLTIFPSYYEPWGYTPHESVAFSVPTITTTLAGFGTWAIKAGEQRGIDDGVEVIYRDDNNSGEVAKDIAEIILDFSLKSVEQISMLRKCAYQLSEKSDWAHFFVHYQETYSKALHNSYLRLSKAFAE